MLPVNGPSIMKVLVFSVYSADPTPGYLGQEIAVHRFYSPTLNRHFFSADQAEVDRIELTGVWDYEGIAFLGRY